MINGNPFRPYQIRPIDKNLFAFVLLVPFVCTCACVNIELELPYTYILLCKLFNHL